MEKIIEFKSDFLNFLKESLGICDSTARIVEPDDPRVKILKEIIDLFSTTLANQNGNYRERIDYASKKILEANYKIKIKNRETDESFVATIKDVSCGNDNLYKITWAV